MDDTATAPTPSAAAEEGLPPTTAETTGLLGSGGGANDDEDPTAAATEPTRLLVRQITGEQTALHLSLDDTVGALKEALRAEWGIEADAQRLLLWGVARKSGQNVHTNCMGKASRGVA